MWLHKHSSGTEVLDSVVKLPGATCRHEKKIGIYSCWRENRDVEQTPRRESGSGSKRKKGGLMADHADKAIKGKSMF